MSRQLGAVRTAVIAWFVVGFVGYAQWGCDEGPCQTPTWHSVVRWGVPLLVALIAGLRVASWPARTRRVLDR